MNKKELQNRIVELEYELNRDAVLNCWNKRCLYERDIKGSIAFIDVNNLKQVNDKMGHICGDEYLKSIVNELQNYGIVYRFGGDEFVVDYFIEPKPNKKYSVGIVYRCDDMSLDEALAIADKKMYKSKKYGKTNTLLEM